MFLRMRRRRGARLDFFNESGSVGHYRAIHFFLLLALPFKKRKNLLGGLNHDGIHA